MAIPSHLEKQFVENVDGYVYFWPSGQGHFSSQQLREIANELDARNARNARMDNSDTDNQNDQSQTL